MDPYLNSEPNLQFPQGGDSSMTAATYSRLLNFLQEDLAVSESSLAIAQKHREQDPGPLPIILWQYGLITLGQLDKIYDWLETI